VSTIEQKMLPGQVRELEAFAERRGWTVVRVVREVASGASTRAQRDELIAAAKRREVDAVVVWKLDRWGRSVPDLMTTLHELTSVGVVFVSLTEAIDLSTPSGRALAGMLAVFAEFERDMIRERVRAGLAYARSKGTRLGRPRSAAQHATAARKLRAAGHSMRAIAGKLGIGATSVRRALIAKR
jgi:DNA invertase Pin-like site-specific DNA recombinase